MKVSLEPVIEVLEYEDVVLGLEAEPWPVGPGNECYAEYASSLGEGWCPRKPNGSRCQLGRASIIETRQEWLVCQCSTTRQWGPPDLGPVGTVPPAWDEPRVLLYRFAGELGHDPA